MQSIGSVGDGKGGRRLRTPQAAEYLGISEATLRKARVTGLPAIPFIRIGAAVVYSTDDLDNFMAANRRMSTSDQPAAA